jgi:universal stress protein E
MEALRNILVLMEPVPDSPQPAFDAAVVLAKRCGASLELLVGEFQDLHPAYFEPMTATLHEFHDSIMARHRAMLERYVQQAAEEGVNAIGEALWGTPFHELVLARVAATRPGLVVKHSVYHNRIERTLFTGSDWHLIRDCPAPLLLVKDPGWLKATRVLACVDPMHSHDKPAALDRQLLRRGAWLKQLLEGELHALYVFNVPTPVGVVGDAYIAAAAMPSLEVTTGQAKQAFGELLKAEGVPAERGHFTVGVAARDIVADARSLDVRLVVMGAVSRRRLERWFVGSTAEAVLDRLPCNVWIEKPESAA